MSIENLPEGVKKLTHINFHTTILQFGNNTGIHVPDEVIEKLGGGRRPLVNVTVNDYSYRSAVATMDGKFMISFSSEHRNGSGIQGGDEVDVKLALDLDPRSVEIPKDLEAALTDAKKLAAFNNSAPSMKKEYVRQVESAKSQETRERRIAKIVEKLS
jgi:hypothetical protein